MQFEEKKKIPGPGRYTTKKRHKTPNMRMSKRKRFKKKVSDVPGPGQYDRNNHSKRQHKNENCGT